MDEKTRKWMTIQKDLHLSDDIDYMCQEKEEEESPALKIAWMHQYKDTKTNYGSQKWHWQYKDKQNNNN